MSNPQKVQISVSFFVEERDGKYVAYPEHADELVFTGDDKLDAAEKLMWSVLCYTDELWEG